MTWGVLQGGLRRAVEQELLLTRIMDEPPARTPAASILTLDMNMLFRTPC
jgi:hypothetical protein